ncbi:signal peptidase I [Tropheryma whipplei]|uniref:signal peptidase I n=1 Tax=Tropheryma whipplei TaxID=2039 RepID=UPI0004AFEACE|nr:signal peptidase I [Tropheryma whipplei]
MNVVLHSSLRSLWEKFRGTLFTLLVVVTIVVIVRTFLFGVYYIPSGSMLNTLQLGDRIFVSRLHPTLFPLKRGDVVVFRDKNHWIPDDDTSSRSGLLDLILGFIEGREPHKLLIKRVIGLPGDRVTCCSGAGRIVVNGRELDETPYLYDATPPASSIVFDVVIPEGRLWVMGDNRNNSADSRLHIGLPGGGFVPIADVVGRALLVFWPFGHWKILHNYHDSTFKGVSRVS